MTFNDTDQRRALGQKFRDLRLAAGLTQWDVACALGYSTAQFISNWERGVSAPPLPVLPPLARVLHVKPSRLVTMVFDYEEAALKSARRLALTRLGEVRL